MAGAAADGAGLGWMGLRFPWVTSAPSQTVGGIAVAERADRIGISHIYNILAWRINTGRG